MAIYARKFIDLVVVNNFMRGGVISGKDLKGGVYELDGKTLVFNSPSATVTFATANSIQQERLTLKEIVDQINATMGLTGFAKAVEGTLYLEDPNAAAAVDLGNTSTALALLGFGQDGAVGTLYAAPDGSPPRFLSLDPLSLSGGGYILTTDE